MLKKLNFRTTGSCLKSKITKLHIRMANSRFDFLQKLSTNIAKNHSVVVLEELKVSNMSAERDGRMSNT
ncbi:MAG: transposase [Prochloraceae cyanobacterium]